MIDNLTRLDGWLTVWRAAMRDPATVAVISPQETAHTKTCHLVRDAEDRAVRARRHVRRGGAWPTRDGRTFGATQFGWWTFVTTRHEVCLRRCGICNPPVTVRRRKAQRRNTGTGWPTATMIQGRTGHGR